MEAPEHLLPLIPPPRMIVLPGRVRSRQEDIRLTGWTSGGLHQGYLNVPAAFMPTGELMLANREVLEKLLRQHRTYSNWLTQYIKPDLLPEFVTGANGGQQLDEVGRRIQNLRADNPKGLRELLFQHYQIVLENDTKGTNFLNQVRERLGLQPEELEFVTPDSFPHLREDYVPPVVPKTLETEEPPKATASPFKASSAPETREKGTKAKSPTYEAPEKYVLPKKPDPGMVLRAALQKREATLQRRRLSMKS